MFTVEQIHQAHDKVKSGADFPKYIKEIKNLGVISFETWVNDSHTRYFGTGGFQVESEPVYALLEIADTTDKEIFESSLKMHQEGKTDYITFCQDCARTGIEKWIVDIGKMTCVYYDKIGHEVLIENIPQ